MSDDSLAARAAWLSYIGGYTQSEIARRLDVSSAKAHRLISQAQKAGLVRVFIEGVPAECVELEEFILHHFGLDSCTVAPLLGDEDEGDDPITSYDAVGVAAARQLYNLMKADQALTIGVGKGRSLAAMVRHMPHVPRPDMKFVAVSGSLTRNLSANPYDVVHNLVERTEGEGYFLPVPYIASSAREKELLQSQTSVREMLQLARQADVYFIGVGAIGDEAVVHAHIRQVRMVSETEWHELRQKQAVGDIMGSFINAQGQPVTSDLNKQALGLGPEDLRGRKVVAVVGGSGKGAAVLAALRTNIITDLVICESTAQQLRTLLSEQAA
ncbi:MAG TPA: sugar-binding transcriptional regulator [Rhodospirillales bacterium]|nr:sugar-binding transcriptional regulator [Rhodospirillales bacterium]